MRSWVTPAEGPDRMLESWGNRGEGPLHWPETARPRAPGLWAMRQHAYKAWCQGNPWFRDNLQGKTTSKKKLWDCMVLISMQCIKALTWNIRHIFPKPEKHQILTQVPSHIHSCVSKWLHILHCLLSWDTPATLLLKPVPSTLTMSPETLVPGGALPDEDPHPSLSHLVMVVCSKRWAVPPHTLICTMPACSALELH